MTRLRAATPRQRPAPRTSVAARYPLDESIGFLVHRAGLVLARHLVNCFKPRDVTPEQWTVLNRLTEGDGVTQREIARRNGHHPTTLARIVATMEMKGLIARHEHHEDRRALFITLTPRGRALHAALVPKALAALADATAGMSAREIRELKRLLRRVFENLAPLHRDVVPAASPPDPCTAPPRRVVRTTAAPLRRKSTC